VFGMEQKNPFNEARKARRKLANERNLAKTKTRANIGSNRRNADKDKLVDLSSKDMISPKGLYI
jgi:hypothetical protein